MIKLEINKVDALNIRFSLLYSKKDAVDKVQGFAELIRLENNDGSFYIPEGTPITDENSNQNYVCDSFYSYQSDKVSIGIGFEEKNKRRASVTISSSILKVLKNHDYTLYKKI